MVAFADDMAMSYSNVDKSKMIDDMNFDLNLFSEWFKNHGMILSNKTKAMLFKIGDDPKLDNCHLVYHFNCNNSSCSSCVNIEFVKEFKYLRINLDVNLNWKCHINNVSKYLNIN